jgi:hypothetical protein
MEERDVEKLHNTVGFIGFRAQATAVGLLQLVRELQRTSLLEQDAVERIKDAIASDIVLTRPRSATKAGFDEAIRSRLDKLFAGEDVLSATEEIARTLDLGTGPKHSTEL